MVLRSANDYAFTRPGPESSLRERGMNGPSPRAGLLASGQEEGLVGWQVRQWSLFGRSSLRWGRAGPADATVVRWDVRSPSISRIHAGECQVSCRSTALP